MEFNDREPIYVQIIEDFKRKMLNGTYQAGQEVPSRRELAKLLIVNPNTVQRAYREMEEMDLIRTVRGQGSVMTDNEIVLSKLREDTIAKVVHEFIFTMRTMGITDDEIVRHLKQDLR